MDIPDIVKEKLIELEDENNQLKAELKRARDRLARDDEILNELEEENIQLRKKQDHIAIENSRCAALEQTILTLKNSLEEKSRESCQMLEQIDALKCSLCSAKAEIDELLTARTPSSADESLVTTSLDTTKMIRLQEERDDAIFELQSAKHRISVLESERNDCAERADAAAAEAQEMARHLKELREQLQQIEAEHMASQSGITIANRGNSMFSEFAEERIKLEADMKLLYTKYETVRRENYQLSNELDEVRLMALRRGRSEESGRCWCQHMSKELVELRGRVRTLDNRLASAKNDLIDMAKTKSGIDPIMKSFYRSLKMEMESLRQERNKLHEERDRFLDENALLAARVSNAEKLAEWANNDVESLKLQLSMVKEREQKKNAAKVAELVTGEHENIGMELFAAMATSKLTPASNGKHVIQTFDQMSSGDKNVTVDRDDHCTPSLANQQHGFFSSMGSTEKLPSEVRIKKIKLIDDHENHEEDSMRGDSMSASELRRMARKLARKGQSKVLPIAEPLMKVAAKSSTALSHDDSSVLDKNSRNDYNSSGINDCENSFSYMRGDEVDQFSPSSRIFENISVFETPCARHHNPLDSSKDLRKKTLEDVPEEKENVSHGSPSRNS